MSRNEGTVDRVLRVIVGLVLVSLVFVGPKTAWGWIGVVPILTGRVVDLHASAWIGLNACSIGKC